MNAPVKFSTPAKIKRPWLLVAIIAALLAAAVLISVYEFSPEFRVAVSYKLVDDEFCVTRNASLGEVTVKCYERRCGYGYMLVTSEGFYYQVDRPKFRFSGNRSTEPTDYETRAAEAYAVENIITLDAMRDGMSEWCSRWEYTGLVRDKDGAWGKTFWDISPELRYGGSWGRGAHFSVGTVYFGVYSHFVVDSETLGIKVVEE